MHSIDSLMSAMDAKIKKAHENLSHGCIDDVIMEEIEILSEILQKYVKFKKKLKSLNTDID